MELSSGMGIVGYKSKNLAVISFTLILLVAVAVSAGQAVPVESKVVLEPLREEPLVRPVEVVETPSEWQERFQKTRETWLPIAIPGFGPWTQEAELLAVDLKKMPEPFQKLLSETSGEIVTPVVVTLAEEPITRETVFMAGYEPFYSLPPPQDYDSLAFVLDCFNAKMSELLAVSSPSETVNAQISAMIRMYDPARVRLRYRVISSKDVKTWRRQEDERIAAEIEAEASVPLMITGGSGILIMAAGGPDDLYFTGIEYSNGTHTLSLHVPDGTGMIDIFTTEDLLLPGWSIATVDLSAQSNLVEWSTSTDADSSFYRSADQYDGDSDGLSDATEELVTATDTDLVDTDGDGMSDAYEAVRDGLAGDSDDDGMFDDWEDENSLDDPAGDADGDGVSNYAEYVQGRDPNAGAVTDLTLALDVVTPFF